MILNNLGCFYQDNANLVKSLEYREKSLNIREKHLGNHSQTAISFDSCGLLYIQFGYFKKSIEHIEKALSMHQNLFNYDIHPLIANSMFNLAYAYDCVGQHRKAYYYKNEALIMRQKLFDENNPSIAIAFNRLGMTHEYLGNYEKAQRYYEDAIKINESNPKTNPFDMSFYYVNIGRIYEKKNQLDKALEFKLMSYNLRKNKLNNNKTLAAESLNELGTVYLKMGEFDLALDYFKQSYDIYLNKLYKDIPNKKQAPIALVLNNIGNVLQNQNKFDESFKYKIESLEMRRFIFNEINENHSSIAESLESIGSWYEAKNDNLKASDYFKNALVLREKNNNNEDHIETAETLTHIARIYQKIGNLNEADNYRNISNSMKTKLTVDLVL